MIILESILTQRFMIINKNGKENDYGSIKSKRNDEKRNAWS